MSALEIVTDIENVKTGLEGEERRKIADRLSGALADTMLLMIKTQVYHWNVVGPLFKPIHELTEEQYTDLFEAADAIAERIRALGYPAPVSFTDLVPKAKLLEDSDMRDAEGMIKQLVDDHEMMVRRLRETAEAADGAGDFVTHDLLVQRLDFHEKAIWMLRAIVAG